MEKRKLTQRPPVIRKSRQQRRRHLPQIAPIQAPIHPQHLHALCAERLDHVQRGLHGGPPALGARTEFRVEEEFLHVDDDQGGAGGLDDGGFAGAGHGDAQGVSDGRDEGAGKVEGGIGQGEPVVVDVAEDGGVGCGEGDGAPGGYLVCLVWRFGR
jgi:hypothetical protein